MRLPDEFILDTRGYYDTFYDPHALKAIEQQHVLIDKLIDGKLFVMFVSGDRKGSIARVELEPGISYQSQPHAAVEQTRYSWDNIKYEIKPGWLYLVAKWDKRRNSCKFTAPNPEIVFLPNYEGPTVYQMFDKKAAKEALLKSPDERDIDGKTLVIGDEVLYINARYGSGFRLTHGTIMEFKAVVDSNGHVISTIVAEKETGLISTITYSSDMIWKK